LASTTSIAVRMTVSGVRSSWLAFRDELPLAGERAVEAFEHGVEVSASSRSSSRGPCSAMRWDRSCSLAARAAAVSWCTGRRDASDGDPAGERGERTDGRPG